MRPALASVPPDRSIKCHWNGQRIQNSTWSSLSADVPNTQASSAIGVHHLVFAFAHLAVCLLQALMMDALILARATGHDVFNALNCLQNQEFLKVPSSFRRSAAEPTVAVLPHKGG